MDPNFVPSEAFPVGTYVSEELDARGWTDAKFAKKSRLSRETVTQILDGDRVVTPEIAAGIARAFKVSAQTWLNLQKMYDDFVMRTALRSADPTR